MADVVMVTGTGRSYALGYNLALRYLEAGDKVIATVRKPSPEIEELKQKYGDQLIVVKRDPPRFSQLLSYLASTASVLSADRYYLFHKHTSRNIQFRYPFRSSR